MGLSLLAYSNALHGEFLYDDLPYIVENPQVQEGGVAEAFDQALADRPDLGLYRPLAVLTYQWQARTASTPFAWHLVNVLLHSLVAVGVSVLARRLGFDRLAAFVSGAVFAVHPVHVEAVTWIVGRAEEIAALLALVSLGLAFSPRRSPGRTLGSAFLFGLACLGKEGAMALPAVVAAHAFLVDRAGLRATLVRVLPFAAVLGLVILLRVAVLGRFGPDVDLAPYADQGILERLGIAAALFGKATQSMLWPWPTRIFYHASEFQGAPWRAAWWIAVLVAMLLFARRDRLVHFSLAAFALTFLPTSNLRPIQETFAERFLYLPSIFGCFVLGVLLTRPVHWELSRRQRIGASLAVPSLALFLALAGTLRSNARFDDALTLWTTTVHQAPGLPFPHYQAAYFSQLAGIVTPRDASQGGAIQHYRRALELDEDFRRRGLRSLPPDQRCRAYLNLGTMVLHDLPRGKSDPRIAAEYLRSAESIGRQIAQLDSEWARALGELSLLRNVPGCGVSTLDAKAQLLQALRLKIDDDLRAFLRGELTKVESELAAQENG